jgi:hypothetical protein
LQGGCSCDVKKTGKKYCATGIAGFENGNIVCAVEITEATTLTDHVAYNKVCNLYQLTAYNTASHHPICHCVGDYTVVTDTCNMGGNFRNFKFGL